MGHLDLNSISFTLSDGRPLLDEVSLRVGEGMKVALIGPNGSGKTTLTRIATGDLDPHEGAVTISGGLGVMRQFIGSVRDESTVRDLLVSVAPPAVRKAAAEVDRTELLMMERDDERDQMAYAQALVDWGDAGGYEHEAMWDMCTVSALGVPFQKAQWRQVTTLSGGEQKRLVLEALLRGPEQVLLLDEPDNYLDVPAKRWLEDQLVESPKTVLFVSHDRELIERVAQRIATLEPGAAGSSLWVHPGRFSTYLQARIERNAKLEERRLRWDEERAKLKALVVMYRAKAAYNADMASRLQAARDPARAVRAGGAARGRADRAEPADAARRRAYGQARGGRRAGRAHGADEAVRPRDLVRRARRGARQQRLGQVALPAAAGRRRVAARHRARAGRRRHPAAGRPHRHGQAGLARTPGVVRADPRAPLAARPHAAGDPAPRRRAP